MRKMTNIEFIQRSNIIHDNKYIYDLVEYNLSSEKVTIICKEHGAFDQVANSHLKGSGCSKCSGNNKSNLNDFINKSNIIHGNKYDYSLVEYTNAFNKVTIICKEHGAFDQVANSHLKGSGCSKCSGNNKSNLNDFINKSNIIHGNKYDYSLVEYTNAFNKVIIICKEHGAFEQRPNNHLNYHGCKKCGCLETNKKNSKNIDYFIKKSIEIHENKYDYSLVEYKNNRTKVKIICKEHGMFEQTPHNHIIGQGCKKCGINKTILSTTKKNYDFIKDAKNVHGDKYDYSLVEYKGTGYKIIIICKKHGEFTQKPYKHLQNQGCPICKQSKLEKEIRLILIENKINFKQQYGGKLDKHYLNGQRLDFYLTDYNIAIECQGDQHFKPVDFGNKGVSYTQEMFDKILKRDNIKYNRCKDIGIELIYFCKEENYTNEYIGELFYKDFDIINKIKKYKNEHR